MACELCGGGDAWIKRASPLWDPASWSAIPATRSMLQS
jgi:hypothetical protein